MSTQINSSLKWVLLTALALIWGSSFILMKKGLLVLAPDQVAAIRMSVACFASFPFVISRLKTVPREKLKYIAVVGVLGSGLPAFLFATAQTRINSSLAGMLNALTPMFTMIIGSFFFKSKFNSKQILGVFIGFLGAIGLVLVKSKGGQDSDGLFGVLIVIATVCYGISVNTIKTHLQELDSQVIAAVSLLFVGIPYFVYLMNTDFIHKLNTIEGTWKGFGYISLLAIMGTALSTVFYFRLVKIASPLFASAVTYFIPIIALGWGILDGEVLNPIHFVAMAAILGGVALINSKQKAVLQPK